MGVICKSIYSPQISYLVFYLDICLLRSQIRPLVSVLYISTFCIVSPIGIGIGMALTDPNQVKNNALNSGKATLYFAMTVCKENGSFQVLSK